MDKKPRPPKPIGSQTIDLRAIKQPKPPTQQHAKKPSLQIVSKNPPIPPPKPHKKRHWLKILLTIFFVTLFVGGLYILLILFYPKITKPSAESIHKKADVVIDNKNKLFIPSVGIESEIKEGDIKILDQGVVWHRLPERGNPEKGGNFILTGHSFVWGYTPQEVTKQSIFYHLSEAKHGDEVIVHWHGKIYKYKINGKKTVKPDQIEVEKQSEVPILTVYTCTTGGASDGRIVITAEPVNGKK